MDAMTGTRDVADKCGGDVGSEQDRRVREMLEMKREMEEVMKVAGESDADEGPVRTVATNTTR